MSIAAGGVEDAWTLNTSHAQQSFGAVAGANKKKGAATHVIAADICGTGVSDICVAREDGSVEVGTCSRYCVERALFNGAVYSGFVCGRRTNLSFGRFLLNSYSFWQCDKSSRAVVAIIVYMIFRDRRVARVRTTPAVSFESDGSFR